MVKKQYQVVWTKQSLLHIKAAYKYISKDSSQNAAKVVTDIAGAVNKAIHNPEFYDQINTRLIMMGVTGLLKNIITG